MPGYFLYPFLIAIGCAGGARVPDTHRYIQELEAEFGAADLVVAKMWC